MFNNNSPVPDNSRKHRNAINTNPLSEIPQRYPTRSHSRSGLLDQINRPAPTPPRNPDFRRSSTDIDLYADENQPPRTIHTQPPSIVSAMSSAQITQKDLVGFYNQITDKFSEALKTISQSQIQRESEFASAATVDTSASAFLRVYPPAWTPLNLKANQTVLLQRLTFIWDESGKDPTTSTRNIGMLLDEEQQAAVQTAILSIKSTNANDRLRKGKWMNAILSIHGPKPHTILKQLIDPQAFKDKSWNVFINRLIINTARVDQHPCLY